MAALLKGDIYRPGNRIDDAERYIGHTYIHGLLQGAVRTGHCPKNLLKKAGIDPEVYDDPSARLDGRQGQRLIFTLQGQMNDILMGFMEQPCKLAFEKEQIKARQRGETLGDSLVTSTQFRQAVRNDMEYEYVTNTQTNEFTVISRYRTVKDVNGHFLYWVRLLSFRQYYSWLIGRYIPLHYVCFTGDPPDPDHLDNYSGLFNCEVRFNQPDNSYTLSASYLKYPIIRTEAEHPDFYSLCPDCFVVPTYETSWTRRTEHALLRLQQDGILAPSFATVAGMMSVQVRTLRHYLAQENETFTRIKARMRQQEAVRLLKTTKMPIADISARLGFGEPGEFTRAFIAWTDCTPSKYRALHADD